MEDLSSRRGDRNRSLRIRTFAFAPKLYEFNNMSSEGESLNIFSISFVAIGIGGLVYILVWPASNLIPALYTTSVVAFIVLVKRIRDKQDELQGALFGGAIGGVLSVAFEKIACDVIRPGYCEHEGLDLLGFTLLFSIPGMIIGLVVGLMVWLVWKVK